MTKTVIAKLSAIPEKSSEKGVKASQGESVGCLYQYLETKKLLDEETVSYPRVIGERDPNNPEDWRWAFIQLEREDKRGMEKQKYRFNSAWRCDNDSSNATTEGNAREYHHFHQKSENQKDITRIRCLQKL
jgi:hypothetical protein